MLNHITIMGRLTATPELKTTPDGTFVTSFTLASERDFTNRATGTKPTDFIDCVAWRGTAEFITRYFTKGRMAIVSGRLQIREYTDKNGIKRRAPEIVAENVYFGDSGNVGIGNANEGQQAEPILSAPAFEELNDEDLPF